MSGGFGDSMTMDDETRKKLLEIEANAKLKQCQPIDQETWENMEITEDYIMESQVFDYELLKQSENYGIKRYAEAIYRGEVIEGKRQGLGVMVYRKARIYEG